MLILIMNIYNSNEMPEEFETKTNSKPNASQNSWVCNAMTINKLQKKQQNKQWNAIKKQCNLRQITTHSDLNHSMVWVK